MAPPDGMPPARLRVDQRVLLTPDASRKQNTLADNLDPDLWVAVGAAWGDSWVVDELLVVDTEQVLCGDFTVVVRHATDATMPKLYVLARDVYPE